MATKKIKINFKMPTPTAAERLHAQQQKNRKAAGLPDPSEYKKKLDAMKSEEVEQLDELKKSTVSSYMLKRGAEFRNNTDPNRNSGSPEVKKHIKNMSRAVSRMAGTKPVQKEEVEQLDEISAQLKASYVAGAKKQIKQSLPFTKKTDEYRDIAKNFIAKRQKGIAKANEEVEQLDEYESKGGVYKHTAKLASSHSYGGEPRKLHDPGNTLHKGRTADFEKHTGMQWKTDELRKAQTKKTLMNVHKNLPEEVEQLDEMPESNMKTKDVHSHLKKSGWSLARSKGGHDVYKHPKAKHSIPVPRHNQLKAPLIRGIMKASKVEEQLEKKGRFVSGPIKQPYKSNTIVTSVKEATDEREYDYEGDMAKSDLRSIIHNAQTLHDMLDDNTNLAEWCQSKITLAEDYISTVTNYMRSEMNEEVKKNEYHIAGKHKFPTKDEHAVTVKHTESGREHVHSGKGKYLSKLIKTRYNINHYFEEVELDEAKKMEYNQKEVYHLQACVRELESMKKQISKLAGNHDAVFKTIDKAIDVFAKEYTKHLNALSAGRGQDDNFKVPEMFSKLKFKKEEVELDEMIRVKTNKPIGTRVADIGPGGKEYNVKTDKAWDDSKKKQPQGADFAAQRRKERLAKSGRMDEDEAMKKESASEPSEGEMKGKQGYSRKAQIVMNAAGKSKKLDSSEKFQKDPELSSEIHKT